MQEATGAEQHLDDILGISRYEERPADNTSAQSMRDDVTSRTRYNFTEEASTVAEGTRDSDGATDLTSQYGDNAAILVDQNAAAEYRTAQKQLFEDQNARLAFERQILTLVGGVQRLDRSRRRALNLRTQLVYEWQGARDRRRWMQESLSDLMKVVQKVITQGATERRSAQLEELYTKARDDFENINRQAALTAKMEQKLARLDYIMHKRDQRLVSTTKTLMEMIRQSDLGSTAAIDDSYSNMSSDDVSTTTEGKPNTNRVQEPKASALEIYYNRSGSVHVMRDRIVELETEHIEEQAMRNFKQDQEQELDISDEVFEEDYQIKLANAERDLRDAWFARKDAILVCLAEGIDPEKEKKPPSQASIEHNHSQTPLGSGAVTPALEEDRGGLHQGIIATDGRRSTEATDGNQWSPDGNVTATKDWKEFVNAWIRETGDVALTECEPVDLVENSNLPDFDPPTLQGLPRTTHTPTYQTQDLQRVRLSRSATMRNTAQSEPSTHTRSPSESLISLRHPSVEELADLGKLWTRR